jgi:peptidoglycan/LPS O-acetylase OafA/YrhL
VAKHEHEGLPTRRPGGSATVARPPFRPWEAVRDWFAQPAVSEPHGIVETPLIEEISAGDPGDQQARAASPFRGDVEGLRAIAVLLVVLYHAKTTGIRGGYVGVDVFFVISGYLITRLLLHDTEKHGKPSLASFWARRIRRILPAACVVIAATVLASYQWLGFLRGGSVARDAEWTSTFLANFHLASLGTDYLGAQELTSPLQHFWSLAVEEQFYLAWPGLVALAVVLGAATTARKRLLIVLIPLTIASFAFSCIFTSTDPIPAYFSPFTRAWELAVGALLAVLEPELLRRVGRSSWATVLGVLGLAAVIGSALVFTARTPFPGVAAALPVLGAAAVLAAGTASAGSAATSRLLAIAPLRVIGRLSFGWYLWHWPVLIIATEHSDGPLSYGSRLLLMVAALGLAAVSLVLVENPIRFSRVLARRTWLCYAFGVALIAATWGLAYYEIWRYS